MTDVYATEVETDMCPIPVDVIVVGGGLAGTLAAILLGRANLRVALIDVRDVHPPEFRAEQLVGEQVEVLRRLGVLDILVHDLVPAERAVATKAGQTVGEVMAPHYGILYETMVNRARRHLPPSVEFIKGQVVDMDLSANRQRVMLSGGGMIEGRLVVVATGLGQRIMRQLGVGRTTVREAHSLAFGFDLEVALPEMFRPTVLVAYGEQSTGAIDYLTIFAVDGRLRANLFTYGDRGDAWAKRFVREPAETLRQAMPHLEQTTGRMQVRSPVQVRVNDLKVASDYRRDGMVLIGDAFQTSCPAAGTGIGRLMNDTDRLCNWHVPRWLATSGMDQTKIDQYYDDPYKIRYDNESLRVANYRRLVTTETGLGWKLHRRRVAVQNKLRLLMRRNKRLRPKNILAGMGMGMGPAALPSLERRPGS